MNYCVKCGDPAPDGKEFCWCCDHESKLHRCEDTDEKDQEEKKE